jgi:hypothetical protein
MFELKVSLATQRGKRTPFVSWALILIRIMQARR